MKKKNSPYKKKESSKKQHNKIAMEEELKQLVEAARRGEDIDERASGYIEKIANDPFNVRDLEQSDVLEVLNTSYIARRFFDKSASWLSQRINNCVVNGKPCELTAEDRAKFRKALEVIAWEIQELADNMS